MDQSEMKKALLDHFSSFHPRPGDALDQRMDMKSFMVNHGIMGPEMADLLDSLAKDGYFDERDNMLWFFSDKWPIEQHGRPESESIP
jgi:hypothetical protein